MFWMLFQSSKYDSFVIYLYISNPDLKPPFFSIKMTHVHYRKYQHFKNEDNIISLNLPLRYVQRSSHSLSTECKSVTGLNSSCVLIQLIYLSPWVTHHGYLIYKRGNLLIGYLGYITCQPRRGEVKVWAIIFKTGTYLHPDASFQAFVCSV